MTCENFLQLCTGSKGKSKLGTELSYKGSYFHRIVKNHLVQAGDIVRGDGRSGESIYGKYFPDESFTVKHDRPYVVSMANSGEDTNNSQFFITLKKSPWLDGRYVAFGTVLIGQDLVQLLSKMGDDNNDPVDDVVISGCGELAIPKAVDEGNVPEAATRTSTKETVIDRAKKVSLTRRRRTIEESSSRGEEDSRLSIKEKKRGRKRARDKELPALAAPPTQKLVFEKSTAKRASPDKIETADRRSGSNARKLK
eukprot:jgi/Bigna1/54776/estExt_Genewise1Plus.C_430019